MTSAVNESEESDVAVKHVPLTAMESPRDKPATDSCKYILFATESESE